MTDKIYELVYEQPKTIQEALIDFMHNIEQWQSEVEGSPTETDMILRSAIYGMAEAQIRRIINSESGAKVSKL